MKARSFNSLPAVCFWKTVRFGDVGIVYDKLPFMAAKRMKIKKDSEGFGFQNNVVLFFLQLYSTIKSWNQ